MNNSELNQLDNYKNIVYWEPWSGCNKVSEGCRNCYNRTKYIKLDGDYILCRFNKTYFYTPTRKVRKFNASLGKTTLEYKIPSGTTIKVCDSSDFFLEEADYYRKRAWKQIAERKDCLFDITTKRPERFYENLPKTWIKEGWNNVLVNVSVENQMRANERVPKLLELPVRHRGIEVAPLQDRVDIREYLSTGLIDKVAVAGESYGKSSDNVIPCNYEYVLDLFEQCKLYDTTFIFYSTGNRLIKDKKMIHITATNEGDLAEFYNLINKNSTFNWKQSVAEMENMERIELASEIYDKVK